MQQKSTVVLKLAIILSGIAVILLCGSVTWLALTQLEQNSEYVTFVYVFLFGSYMCSIPFFIALYNGFKLLNYIDTDNAFTELSIKALKAIMRCSFVIFVICTVGGLPFFYKLALFEDAPGLVIIGIFISAMAFIITVFASVLKKLFKDAIDVKTENDLTV